MWQCVRNFNQKTALEKRMTSPSLFTLCFTLCLVEAADGLYSTDPLLVVATAGQRITLPCGLPSIQSCSSINWKQENQFSDVVKAGRVTSKADRYHMLWDCSLEIDQVVLDDAHVYTCESGSLNSTVSLRILEVTKNPDSEKGTIELQCHLNTFKGYAPCNEATGIRITWTAQDDAPINGKRFRSEKASACFSKLIITEKLTDHHRTWKCHLTQNHQFKASVSYKTTVEGGLEEVFSGVGESVSLTCTSSLSSGGDTETEWTVNKTPPIKISTENGQTKAFHVNKDSSLVISNLSPLNAGDYQCTSSGLKRVLNTIRLHTLHVSAESGPGGVNLTCVLTCAEECDGSFNLTWSGTHQEGQQSRFKTTNKTLISVLLLPESSDEIVCSVLREGSLMASRRWCSDGSLQKLAWIGLLVCLLACTAAGGLYVYKKRKQIKDPANKQSSIRMTRVYDVIQDEEVGGQTPPKGEVPTTEDGFYNLLQAVN